MVSGVPDLSLPEIIETYWNVNHDSTGIKRRDCTEIIETYWNVNVIERAIEDNLTGNNRNILECKFFRISSAFPEIAEIIETYWNVNCKMLQFQDSSHIEIIETYWNVNWRESSISS